MSSCYFVVDQPGTEELSVSCQFFWVSPIYLRRNYFEVSNLTRADSLRTAGTWWSLLWVQVIIVCFWYLVKLDYSINLNLPSLFLIGMINEHEIQTWPQGEIQITLNHIIKPITTLLGFECHKNDLPLCHLGWGYGLSIRLASGPVAARVPGLSKPPSNKRPPTTATATCWKKISVKRVW